MRTDKRPVAPHRGQPLQEGSLLTRFPGPLLSGVPTKGGAAPRQWQEPTGFWDSVSPPGLRLTFLCP